MPSAQTLIAALIVAGCAVYAIWALLPPAVRRACAAAALRLHLPAFVVAPLRRTAQASRVCGCDGCDRAPPPSTSAQPIRFHPRR